LVTIVSKKNAEIQASNTLKTSAPASKFAMRTRMMQAAATKSNALSVCTDIVILIIVPVYATTRRIAGATTTKRLLYNPPDLQKSTQRNGLGVPTTYDYAISY